MGILSFFRRRIITECGHGTKRIDEVSAFGESITTILPIKDRRTPYCHRCIEKMAIRCAWCGNAIFIGDPITLYAPTEEDFEIPEHAVVYNESSGQLVGCMGWDCAITGADRAGFWLPPGEVHRVPTGFEMMMRDIQKGGDGIVIVSDISSP